MVRKGRQATSLNNSIGWSIRLSKFGFAQAVFTVPWSPSSSTGVMSSQGMFIFLNQEAIAPLAWRFHDADDFALGQIELRR
jgi:hypothetical protein